MFTLAFQLHPLSNNTLSNVMVCIPLPADCEPVIDDENACIQVNEGEIVWMNDHVSPIEFLLYLIKLIN